MWVSVPLQFAVSSRFYFDIVTVILLLLDVYFLFSQCPVILAQCQASWLSISSTHLCVLFQREPFAFGVEIPRDYRQFSEAEVRSANAGLLSLTLV